MNEQYNVTKWYLGGIVEVQLIQQIILLIALKVIFLPSRYLYSLLFNNHGQVAVATVTYYPDYHYPSVTLALPIACQGSFSHSGHF